MKNGHKEMTTAYCQSLSKLMQNAHSCSGVWQSHIYSYFFLLQ